MTVTGHTKAQFLGSLDLRDIGGGRFQLLLPLCFYSTQLRRVVMVPRGYDTDLASIPPYVPGWLVPKLGNYDYPAVIHDAAYDAELQNFSGRVIRLTKRQADRLFLEGMQARGVNILRRQAMYLAVRLFGRGKTWGGDR